MRDDDFARQQEIAATLTEDDMSDRAAVARGATLLHRAWGNANEARTNCDTFGTNSSSTSMCC
jgi:hypothetical protein